jgi:TRAP transporter 4TM/12TM fusion protein
MSNEKKSIRDTDIGSKRYRELGPVWKTIIIVLGLIIVAICINQVFLLGFFKATFGTVLLANRYLYLIGGTLLAMVFIVLPATETSSRTKVPWYDVLLFVSGLALTIFFVIQSDAIIDYGWEYVAPEYATYAALSFWLLLAEGGRRSGGLAVLFVVAIISLYPLYVASMPEIISGVPSTIWETANFHMYSEESYLGIPMRALGLLVFGFMLFGVALIYTGAGGFFINMAFALMGHKRGGPAKVAIFSSGLFGSMSGGPVTNVLTTGTLTIPAMTKIGMQPKTAGAIEACASTGGVLMPPIMGATAFIMANFLNVSYVEVALAAVIPSALYYFGLFMQIDSYAAANQLEGVPKEELPTISAIIKDGWHYLLVFGVLIWMLIFLKQESKAPFYATILLLALNQLKKGHRMDKMRIIAFLYATGCLLAEISALLGAIGLIVGALQLTGMTGTLTNDLVFLAGSDPFLLLIMGALTSFVLGIGMTVTAAYIFLAIILAPSLIALGLNPMSIHMFLLYWGMLSFITPPVALAAFAASTISRSGPMTTGVEAMRIGSIIYFIPFFFVLNPALIGQADMGEVILVCVTALVGIVFVAAALQGYLQGIGKAPRSPLGILSRLLMFIGGIVLAAPGGGLLNVDHWVLIVVAIIILLPGMAILKLQQPSTVARA